MGRRSFTPVTDIHSLDSSSSSCFRLLRRDMESMFEGAIEDLEAIPADVRAKSILFVMCVHEWTLHDKENQIFDTLALEMQRLRTLGLAAICLDLSGSHLVPRSVMQHMERVSEVLIQVESREMVKMHSEIIVGEMVVLHRARRSGRISENSSFLVIGGQGKIREVVVPLSHNVIGNNIQMQDRDITTDHMRATSLT